MKQKLPAGRIPPHRVAPFTGAWIETRNATRYTGMVCVAPFTGAWIETRYEKGVYSIVQVAPFTGAWIETIKGVPIWKV